MSPSVLKETSPKHRKFSIKGLFEKHHTKETPSSPPLAVPSAHVPAGVPAPANSAAGVAIVPVAAIVPATVIVPAAMIVRAHEKESVAEESAETTYNGIKPDEALQAGIWGACMGIGFFGNISAIIFFYFRTYVDSMRKLEALVAGNQAKEELLKVRVARQLSFNCSIISLSLIACWLPSLIISCLGALGDMKQDQIPEWCFTLSSIAYTLDVIITPSLILYFKRGLREWLLMLFHRAVEGVRRVLAKREIEEVIPETDLAMLTDESAKIELPNSNVLETASIDGTPHPDDTGKDTEDHADFVRVPLNTTEFVLVYVGLLLALFLAALDQTIVSTALKSIIQDLGEQDLVPWI
ncbi:hypothetical protein HDU98_003238, partial [Podochytrium sp. JEL0797]